MIENNKKELLTNLYLGIALGTTNTVVSVKEEGNKNVTTLLSKSGSRLIRSIVHFGESNIEIGEDALDFLEEDPLNTFYSTKRLIGKSFKELSKDFLNNLNYKVKNNSKKKLSIYCSNQNRLIPVQAVSAEILKGILKIFHENYSSEDYLLRNIVITVPAYFNHNQRKATLEAAALAGLSEVEIINEPSAAAIAYGDIQEKALNILVFDIGGGTFDMSLVNYDGDGFWDIVGSSGDDLLGGDDFDNVMSNIILKKCKKDFTGIKISDEGFGIIRKLSTEYKQKFSLKNKSEYKINIPNIGTLEGKPISPTLTITKKEFEDACEGIYKKISSKIKEYLALPEINNQMFDKTILVGGTSRIPLFQKLVYQITNKKISQRNNLNPDEAVSIGAAKYAEYCSKGLVRVSDVTPLNLGTTILEDKFDVIIPMNSKIPVEYTSPYTTVEDFQEIINFEIIQGNRKISSENTFLGEVILDRISPMPAGDAKTEMSIRIDSNGILTAEATDLIKKETRKIIIKNYQRLSREEILKLRDDAKKYESEDEKKIAPIIQKYEVLKLIDKSKQYLTPLINNKDIKIDLIDAINDFEKKLLSEKLTLSEIIYIKLSIQHIYKEKNLDYMNFEDFKKNDKKNDKNNKNDDEIDDESIDNPFN